VILHCNFEELRALTHGADLVLRDAGADRSGAVAAPPEAVALIEQLLPRLGGDLSVETFQEQRSMERAVAAICGNLQKRLEETVVEHSPGHEAAVNYYFDFGYARTVLHRLEQMGAEMRAIIEVASGEPVNKETATTFTFPD
jgi:hypothetical protein